MSVGVIYGWRVTPIRNPNQKPITAGIVYQHGGPKIAEWHRRRDVTRRLLVGAYGVGKSYIVIFELLHLLLHSKTYSGKLALVVGRDHAQNLNVLLPIIKKMLRGDPKAKIAPYPRNAYEIRTSAPITIEFANGAKIIMLSQNSDAIDGYNPAIVLLDEANKAPESVYLSLENRIGRDGEARGMFIIAANPSHRGHWLWERFFKHQYETGQWPEDSYGVTLALSDSSHVPAHRIRSMEQTYGHSPVLYARAVLGQFMDLSGQVYSSFDPDLHVLTPSTQPTFDDASQWRWYAGLDFGWHDPTAFVLLALNTQTDVWYVVREYKHGGELIKEHARRINAIIREQSLSSRPIIFSEHEAQTRKEYGAVGIQTTLSNKDILPGINAVNTLFAEQRLFIFENCVELKREIEGYQWSSTKDAPARDQEDHLLDALRYGIYSNTQANVRRLYLPGEMASENPRELKFLIGYSPLGVPEYRTVPITERPVIA